MANKNKNTSPTRWYKAHALKEAIAQQDTLTAGLLVASRFSDSVCEDDYLHKVAELSATVSIRLDGEQNDLVRFERLVDVFFRELAFSGNTGDAFASKYSQLNEVIEYRTGVPVTLAILFCHIAKNLGFDVSGVNFPGHFIVRYDLNDKRTLFVDPMTGQFTSWQALEQLYFEMVDDTDEEDMPAELLEGATAQDTIIRMLHNLKSSFLREQQFASALEAIELLLELNPDDPYERRDRGYVLHQLECHQVANADYRYFIKRCPQDPAANLLKLKLRGVTEEPPVTFH